MKAYGIVIAWMGSLTLVIVSLLVRNGAASAYALIAFVLLCIAIFRDTLNTVQYVGRVYWIVRDSVPAGTPRIAKGFMRMVAPPWLVGSGIQIRVMNRTVQVGLCTRQAAKDETQGVLNALEGRFLEEHPEEIGGWK